MFARRWYLFALVLVATLALTLPRPSNGTRGEAPYVVRPRDTLWNLAEERFGGDPREGVWRIQARNGLQGAALQPGMILYLPTPGGDA